MYFTETVDARDADGHKGALDVTVSIGEFDPGQTVVEFKTADEYQMICLDEEGAAHLINALTRAITAHAAEVAAG